MCRLEQLIDGDGEMQLLLNSLKGVIPTDTGILTGGIAAGIGAALAAVGWDEHLSLLCWLMIADYISGMYAAYEYKRKHPRSKRGLDSRVGFAGIAKKMLVLGLVLVAHAIDGVAHTGMIHPMVAWFYIGNEGLSIFENAAKCGAPVPSGLQNVLEQLAKEKSDKR